MLRAERYHGLLKGIPEYCRAQSAFTLACVSAFHAAAAAGV